MPSALSVPMADEFLPMIPHTGLRQPMIPSSQCTLLLLLLCAGGVSGVLVSLSGGCRAVRGVVVALWRAMLVVCGVVCCEVPSWLGLHTAMCWALLNSSSMRNKLKQTLQRR